MRRDWPLLVLVTVVVAALGWVAMGYGVRPHGLTKVGAHPAAAPEVGVHPAVAPEVGAYPAAAPPTRPAVRPNAVRGGEAPLRARSLPLPELKAGVVFNEPRGGPRRRAAVEDHIVDLIDGTPEGAMISVAMYHFASPRLAAALTRADRRGAAVRVVVDGKSGRFAAYHRLRRALGFERKRRSWLVTCPAGHGCLGYSVPGRRAINHNKFFLFSRSAGREKIVVQTSANATKAARDHQWNDALTLRGAGPYQAYRDYFHDLATRRSRTGYHRSAVTGRYLILFSPWPARNPIVDIMNEIYCAKGGRIRVAMTIFSHKGLAQRLAGLHRAGCQVDVAYGDASRSVRKILDSAGVRLRRLAGAHRVHSKYMLIDAMRSGVRQKITLAGSGNYTQSGLHGNDEVVVGVSDASLHDAYLAGFRRMTR